MFTFIKINKKKAVQIKLYFFGRKLQIDIIANHKFYDHNCGDSTAIMTAVSANHSEKYIQERLRRTENPCEKKLYEFQDDWISSS